MDNSTIVQPLLYHSTLHVCNSTRIQMHLCWLCSIHGMDLKFFLHMTITKSSNRSLVIWSSFTTTLLMCWQFPTYLSHLYIKEWKPEDWQDSYNNFASAKPLLKLFRIKVHLEFLNNFHILEVLRVLSDLYVNTPDCISSVQSQTFSL